jgi:hypothetical protein
MLFEFLSDDDQDSNNSSDIISVVFTCKNLYHGCDVYLKKARFLWTRTIDFDDKKAAVFEDYVMIHPIISMIESTDLSI